MELEWLLEAAKRLATLSSMPVDVISLLRRLGIELEVVVGLGPPTLRKLSSRSYRVVLPRSSFSTQPLSPRERFSVAHEIGHVLVDFQFGYRPATERAYHDLETWCDLFAGRLLVPDNAVAALAIRSWRGLAETLKRVADDHSVSYAVAARRLAERYKSLVLARVNFAENKAGQRVLKVAWVAGDGRFIDLQLHRHITTRHCLSALLLEPSARRAGLAVDLADVGRVKVHVLRQGTTFLVLGSSRPGTRREQVSRTQSSA